MPHSLKNLFNVLKQIIAMTDIWLFTSATKTEVTKLAGKVFQENYRRDRSTKNACIGIAPWGCIGEREQLTSDGCLVSLPGSLYKCNVDYFVFLFYLFLSVSFC